MTPAVQTAQRAKIAFTVHEYEHDAGAAYGVEAVERLGLDPERVFKTLVTSPGERAFVVAVVPVAASLDLRALGTAVGSKRLEMADPHDAERVTGYDLGGISPLGQRKQLPTVVDASAEAFDTVFVSAGRRGLEIELAPADLVRLTQATVAPISRL
jgi:Cys-tRNA(Pro)/Cys-tRNA(Cys) deacylase